MEEFKHFFGEAKLTTEKRNDLDDSEFGIPELRKYPLYDKQHVLSAVTYFGKAESKYKPELARRIVKRAKELNIEWYQWFDTGKSMSGYLKDLSKSDQQAYNNQANKHIKESGEKYQEILSDTPETKDLLKAFMNTVKYDNASPDVWRLKSPDEVMDKQLGNCHDTAYYAYKQLKHKHDAGILFFIEYNSKTNKGGATHSVCYEKLPNEVVSIELSWKDLMGTFPANNVKELAGYYKNMWDYHKGCDTLLCVDITDMSGIHPGMTLDEYVKYVLKHSEVIFDDRKVVNESFVPDDLTSGTSDFDNDDNDPDDCYSESNKERINDKGEKVPEKCDKCGSPVEVYLQGEPIYQCSNRKCKKYFGTLPCNINESVESNGITNAKLIAARIHEKVQKDSKPPTGNQNCQICTWCAEAQFRGRTDMPRPVYSPRDPVLDISGERIVESPRVYSLKSGFDDMLDILTEHPYARFYCHAKWKEGNGGHEFLIINEDGKSYIMDPQQGTVDKFLETHPYIRDLKWDDSYLARMDNAVFNESILKEFNTLKSLVPWNGSLDIPYMLEHGMLSEEEAEQYWKEHPDEASKDRHFLSFEELDRLNESKNVFTSGDFAKYGKDVDLTDARGPITESVVMEFDHKSEKLPVKAPNTDKVYFRAVQERFVPHPESGLPDGIWMRNAVKADTQYIFDVEWDTLDDKYKNDPKILDMFKEDARESVPRTRIICYTDENNNSQTIGLLQAYQKDDYWYIGEIWLKPEFRGKGIGKAILEKEIEAHDWLSLDVNKKNKHAIDLYIDLGFKIISENEDGYRMDLKKNSDTIQEAWNDIKNGVNPFSNKIVYHISTAGHYDGQVFKPRIPEYLEKSDENETHFEDTDNPRVCFSPSIEGALNAIIVNLGTMHQVRQLKDLYVYIPEKPLSSYKHKTTKQLIKEKKVFDANITNEIWIEEPVRLREYGVIRIDQVSNYTVKKTVPNSNGDYAQRYRYSFKWHWLVKPKVLKDRPFDYSANRVVKLIESDLWRLKYGLIDDGRLKANASESEYRAIWKLSSPEVFDKIGGGNCFDYTEWTSGYFDAYGIKCNKYFMDFGDKYHSFVVVKDDKTFIVVDGSLKRLDSKANLTRECNSLNDCFEYILFNIEKNDKSVKTPKIYDYTNTTIDYGMTMKEFIDCIESRGKEIKFEKQIKEEFSMDMFERDPSILKLIMESESDNNEKDFPDIEGDGDGDAVGVDNTNVQNQYDPKEIESLNKLIASEADAISDYFEAGKATRVPVLSKLYADIGEEERFHLEQLIYAKSTITGEEYEPRDPKVREEYKELLAMGMDEESAMATAIDKLSISVSTEEELSPDEEEEISESFAMFNQMSRFVSLAYDVLLESIADNSDIEDSLYTEYTRFFEEMFIMEEVDNLTRKETKKDVGGKNPIRVVWDAFRAVYKILIGLVRKAKLAITKVRLKDKRKWAWIKKHGIKGLFQSGVHMYFYSDKRNAYEVGQALTFIQMINVMNEKIIKDCGLNIDHQKYNVDGYVKKLSDVEKAPSSSDSIIQRIKGSSLEEGVKNLQGMVLSKTKIIVTESNESYLEELFFGYTPNGYEVLVKNDEGQAKSINISRNIFNQLDICLSALEIAGNETNAVIEALDKLYGQGGIYSNNPKLYNLCVSTASQMTRSIDKFIGAVSSDIKAAFDLNKGLKEIVDKIEDVDSTKKEKKEGLNELGQYRANKAEEINRVREEQRKKEQEAIAGAKYR